MAKKKIIRRRRKKGFRLQIKETTFYTFSSVCFFAAAGLIMFSFSRRGVILSKLFNLLNNNFGWTVVFIPFLFISAGLMMLRMKWRISHPNVLVGGLIFFYALASITQAGRIGTETWQNLTFMISGPGTFLVLLAFAFIGFVIAFNTSLEEMILYLIGVKQRVQKQTNGFKSISKPKFPTLSGGRPNFGLPDQQKEPPKINQPAIQSTVGAKTGEADVISGSMTNLPSEGQAWHYPPLSLLNDEVSGKADRGDIKKNMDKIEDTLESFGIAARVAEVNYGPAVTQYALEIALGTKLSKITALANDLALALAAPTGQIRVEAPIPGRSYVGIEVPNRSPEFVGMKKILTSDEMKKSKSKLAIGLGLDVSGKAKIADIAKMPHALIAGSTGSGKSVAINSFITSIIFRASPSEVKFILVDPKRVELTQYNGIPHLISPVIVEPKQVLSALRWAIAEMDRRYKSFAEVGARNIDAFNENAGFIALPYIVIIIDELADIMLFAPNDVEDAICRIAQMARATGIHLILATQRPSVDVITGLIKANIPCRIAFNVSSQIDSRVILDTPGAEKLLGRGDMLYTPPDQAKPSRIQGTYVSEPEIQRLLEYIRQAGVPVQYTEEVTSMPTSGRVMMPGQAEGEERDEFFADAVRLVFQDKKASASLLQRKLKLGYARAARIIDQMETAGVVGKSEGAKPREILISDPEAFLNQTNKPQQ